MAPSSLLDSGSTSRPTTPTSEAPDRSAPWKSAPRQSEPCEIGARHPGKTKARLSQAALGELDRTEIEVGERAHAQIATKEHIRLVESNSRPVGEGPIDSQQPGIFKVAPADQRTGRSPETEIAPLKAAIHKPCIGDDGLAEIRTNERCMRETPNRSLDPSSHR